MHLYVGLETDPCISNTDAANSLRRELTGKNIFIGRQSEVHRTCCCHGNNNFMLELPNFQVQDLFVLWIIDFWLYTCNLELLVELTTEDSSTDGCILFSTTAFQYLRYMYLPQNSSLFYSLIRKITKADITKIETTSHLKLWNLDLLWTRKRKIRV